jgi:hypothetical protein
MKNICLLAASLALFGCALTPTQKKVAYAAGAVVATAVVISATDGKKSPSYCGDSTSFCGPIRP